MKVNIHGGQGASGASDERVFAGENRARPRGPVLRFKATNTSPHFFDWLGCNEARLDYAEALSRMSTR